MSILISFPCVLLLHESLRISALEEESRGHLTILESEGEKNKMSTMITWKPV